MPSMRRRELLLGGATALAALTGCQPHEAPWDGGWVGASAARGHRLRAPLPAAGDGPLRRTETLIIGSGVSGLACARALATRGRDFALLELEDEAGGNARGHRMNALPCPLGAHYLPVPGPQAREVQELLFDLGLARMDLGRVVYDERHLCHSPQERLFINGAWVDGLLPPADSPRTLAQYRQFSKAVSEAQQLGFSIPSLRAPWNASLAALDAQPFEAWLNAQGLDDAHLRWYLDYCCRDDYGAGSATVSAWAGLHYFASRHGFSAPGDETGEQERILTWPEGNGWLTARMAEPLKEGLLAGRTVLRVSAGKHAVDVLAWNEKSDAPERWQAQRVVLATPLFIAKHLIDASIPALDAVVAQQRHAPWLVTNLLLKRPLLDRIGVGQAWDNVAYGSPDLGYVDARHQSLRPDTQATLLTAYWALPESERSNLLQAPWRDWAGRVISQLALTHPDLPQALARADLMRWGHAMSIPAPGLRGSAALAALQSAQGRLAFVHSDLAGYSVFEEAYTRGVLAAQSM